MVANRKGGCGKTTVATQFAAALAVYGDTCYLADTDRQRSSLGWLANRPSNAAVITAFDWTREIGKTPEGNGFLVIDTAAGLRGKHAVEMVALADLLLLPLAPSAFDEGATRRFLGRVRKSRRIVAGRTRIGIVGNRIQSGTLNANRFERFVAGLGHPLVARLRDSQLYVQYELTGVGLFDAHGKRAVDLQSDWRPLLDFVYQQI